MPADKSPNQTSILSISQASRMLGVSEVTLRQWTDEGKIKAFVTPGGHRRYSEHELRLFMGKGRRVHGITDLVAKIKLAPEQELQIAQTHFAGTPWYSKLDPDSKARLGELGKRIHGLVITYITKQSKREETMQLARDIGREFGSCLIEIGLSLTDSLEAFLSHRAPLINAANDLIKKRETLNERALEALPLVTQITDEVLLSLVETYQDHLSGISGKVEASK